MKLSVSLPEDDVAVLDEYVRVNDLPSRSSGIQLAVRMLRHPDLERDYESAWEDWESTGEAEAWMVAASDGLGDAAR